MTVAEWFAKTEGVFNWQECEDTIGWKHDYKVDDPEVDTVAQKMVDGLNALIDKLNANPGYWQEETQTVDSGTFYGYAEAIADKAYAGVCTEL